MSAPGVPTEGSSRARSDVAVITAAELPYDAQVRARRKRYVLMMSMRVPLLVAATLCYRIPWLAIALLVVSIPLPWMAVLIANDRPARKARMAVPGTLNHERALPPAPREIIDSE
ncbi:DUF3099 domain-containing protein [Nakamurella endophytica]|uniref:DUF3099 domain-containing protein n=1 Tax=Nakamurella endophytica TaxID=1748367 RepID=A0A917T6X9_9ACTN|nr:DUF3099 domain-containing protein [Nakamurella endophytica]GGM11809.1 hypothetical protein GCM10011594_34590 [Nakamurella endophytica]